MIRNFIIRNFVPAPTAPTYCTVPAFVKMSSFCRNDLNTGQHFCQRYVTYVPVPYTSRYLRTGTGTVYITYFHEIDRDRRFQSFQIWSEIYGMFLPENEAILRYRTPR